MNENEYIIKYPVFDDISVSRHLHFGGQSEENDKKWALTCKTRLQSEIEGIHGQYRGIICTWVSLIIEQM